MKVTQLLAVACYALSALGTAVFFSTYLVRSRFLHYHQEAIGIPWERLDPRLQTLLIALMRVAGGGVLASCIAIEFMVFFPFRSGSVWAKYAIPTIGMVAFAPAFYATILVRARTKAKSPTTASAITVGLLLLGLAFSLLP